MDFYVMNGKVTSKQPKFLHFEFGKKMSKLS